MSETGMDGLILEREPQITSNPEQANGIDNFLNDRAIAKSHDNSEEPIILPQRELDTHHNIQELRDDTPSSWLDSLPYPNIDMPYGSGGDANAGETLMLNWYRWVGNYNPDIQTLNLTAAPTEHTTTQGEYTYDTRFAELGPDGNVILKPDNSLGFKPAPTEGNRLFSEANTFNKPGYDELPTENNGHELIYRGINETDLKKYLKDRLISAGDVVAKIREEGQIFFAPDPNEPFGYAANRNQFDMASFGHPAYMISIEKPEGMEPRKDKSVVLTNPVPLDKIIHIYEIRPAIIKSTHIPSVVPDDKSKYMALPPVNITSFNGPRGVYMYKEVSLNDLKESARSQGSAELMGNETEEIAGTESREEVIRMPSIPELEVLPLIPGGHEKTFRLLTTESGGKYIVATYENNLSPDMLEATVTQQKILSTLFPERYVVQIYDHSIGEDGKARFLANFVDFDKEKSLVTNVEGWRSDLLIPYIKKIRESAAFRELIPDFKTIGLIPEDEGVEGGPYINELAGNTLFDKDGKQIIIDVQSPVIDVAKDKERPALNTAGILEVARKKGIQNGIKPLLEQYQNALNLESV